MKKFFLLTAFGKDRPGIVAGVSRILFDLGGNIEDASMTRLGGEFTVMLVAGLPASATSAKLEKAFGVLEKKSGLQVEVKPIPSAAAHRSKEEPAKYLLSLYGTDHPGIVHRVTQALADRKASITDLQTKVIGQGKKSVYVMLLEVQVPDNADLDGLRNDLDDLRQELKVDISFQDIETIPL